METGEPGLSSPNAPYHAEVEHRTDPDVATIRHQQMEENLVTENQWKVRYATLWNVQV